MNSTPEIKSKLGIVLFAAGTVLGILLLVGLVWPDLEAMFYDFQKLSDKAFSVSCPVFLTQNESGEVRIEVTNNADKTIQPLVRITISNQGLFRFEETRMTIGPGETQTLAWKVSKADVDLRFFVLANVFILPEYQFPSRQGTCGTMLLPVSGISGMDVFLIVVGLSLLGLASGAWLWTSSFKPLFGRRFQTARAMQFMVLVALAGFIFGYLGHWALGGFALIVIVLLILALMYLSSTK